MGHSISYHAYHKAARIELAKAQTEFISFHHIKNLRTKKQPMLKLLSTTDHKKKTLIEFKSILEVTKSTIQVKPSCQILTLPQPNYPQQCYQHQNS